MELVVKLLEVLAPVVITASLGFAWARGGGRFDHAMVTSLVTSIGAPALVFHTLATVELDSAVLRDMGLAALLAVCSFALVAVVGLRLAGLSVRDFLGAMIFPNIGNMGLPVCLFAFGQQGLALAIVVFAVVSSGFFTVGIWLLSRQSGWHRIVLSPLLWAVALGLTLNLAGLSLPQWLENTTGLLGQFTIPLMLFTLGVSLSGMHLVDLRLALPLGLARVWGGAAIGLIVAAVLGLEGAARGVLVLQCAMPVAVFAYLMAQRYDRSPRQIAALVLVSTLTALVSLPFLVSYLWASSPA